MEDEVHVDRRGEPDGGPSVVIVHGAMDRSSSFGRVARQLRDLPVLRYDRRGYGESVGLEVGPADRHVDDLLEVIGPEPALVFGHSMGGVIGLMAAIRSPERVAGLVTYEAPMPWLPWWPGTRRDLSTVDPPDEAERFMRQMVGDRIWERLPMRIRQARRSEGAALLADLASVESGMSLFEPSSVTRPTVVAFGSATTWWHQRAANELAAGVPGAELVELSGADHGAHLGQPRAVAELIRHARHRACESGPRG